jgi:hypothetical protein
MCLQLQHNVVLLYLLWPNPAVAGAVFPPSGDGGLLNLVDNPKIQYIRHSKTYKMSVKKWWSHPCLFYFSTPSVLNKFPQIVTKEILNQT